MKMDDAQLDEAAAAIAEQWFTGCDVWSMLKRLPKGYDPESAFDSAAFSMESMIRIIRICREFHTIADFDLDRLCLPEDAKVEFFKEIDGTKASLKQLTDRIESSVGKAVVARAIELSYREAEPES